MPRHKKKCLVLRERRSVKKRNNNMDETEDSLLTSRIEIGSNSEMIQPNIKDVIDVGEEASTELAIDTTKMNEHPASDDSDISISELLERVDARIANKEAKENQTQMPNDVSDISISKLLERVDARIANKKAKENQTQMPEVILEKTLVKSEPIEIIDSPEYKNKDVPSTIEVETDSEENIFEPKVRRRGRPRVKAQKTVIRSEEIVVVDDSPTCEKGIRCVDSCMKVDSISEKTKPIKKRKRIRKPRSEQLQSPSTSEAIELNNNPVCKTEDVALVTEIQTDLIMEISKPENKLTCKAEGSPPKKLTSEPMEINISPGSKSKDTSLATKVQTDSITEITKPKVKRIRKSRAKKLEVKIKPDVMETTCNIVNETKDTPPKNDNVSKLITTSEIQTIPKKFRGEEKLEVKIKPDVTETTCNLVNETKDTPPKNDNLSKLITTSKIKTIPKKSRGEEKSEVKIKPNVTKTTCNLVNETKDTPPKNDNVSKLITTSKIKTIPKKSRGEEKLEVKIKPDVTETTCNLVNETKDTPPKNDNLSKLITTSKIKTIPKKSRGEEKLEVKIKPDVTETTCNLVNETKDTPRKNDNVSKLITTSKIKTIPKKSRGEEKLEVKIKPDTTETTCNLVNETKDTPPKNDNVSKLITTSTIKTIPKRSRGRPRKDPKTLKKIEVSNNLEKSAEDLIQTNAVSETPEAKNNIIYNSEETSEAAQPGTDFNVIDTARKIVDHVAETKNLSPENRNLNCSIPETVKNKYPLFDKKYQPKVLLWNIAHSDKLTPEQREMLLGKKQYETNLSLEIVADSSINQSKEESTPHDVIIPSSAGVKKNDEAIKSISENRACEHSNTRKRRVRKRKEIITPVKLFPPKKLNELHASKLSARRPGTNSQSASGTDVLYSVGNEEFGIEHRCSPSTGLSLEEGSLTITRHNDFENKSKKSISPPEEEIVMCSLSDIIELDIPLDLSIRNSEKSISNTSDFSKPGDNYIGDICSVTKKSQLPDTNVQDVGFGSSTFHVTNLSTSFTLIEDSVAPAVNETVIKPSKKINTRDSRTLQKYKLKDEKPTIKHSNKAESTKPPISSTASKPPISSTASKPPISSTASKPPISSTASKPPISSTASKRGKKRPLEKPAKPPSRDVLSLKVSIPAKHYFNKRRSVCEKLETVVEKKEPATEKAQTKSQTNVELNETNHQESENVTHSTTTEKHSEVNVVTTEPQASNEEDTDQSVRLPTPLPDMCILDDTDTDFQTASEKPASSGPTISNVRSLPKIVVDEILPKGTINLSSLNCRPSISHVAATKIEDDRSYSMNINEIGESHNIRELTIHTQSTYTSIVNQNSSQSQITTHCWNQAHASNDMDNINASMDTVEHFQESRNPQGISSTRFSENIKSDGDNQSFIVIEKTFDSTQLWKICPELESYFSNDDVINNNNEEISSNFKAPERTSCNNNTVDTILTDIKMDTEENSHDSTDLPSDIDNITQLNENTNDIPDVCDGVVAVNVNPSGMDVESSESNTTSNYESNTKKCAVITNLTTANLRSFNNISNYDGKTGLKWSTETWQCYSSQSNNKTMPGSVIESSCAATESTLGSQREFHPAKSRKRKRKWIEDDKNDNLRPEVREKRLKLNRNKWNIERQNFRNTINSSKPNVAESFSSENSGILNVGNAQSPKKISHDDLEEKKTIENELNITAEESLNSTIIIRKPEELDEKMLNYTTTNEKENKNTSTSIPGTSKCDFGTDDRLLGELCITLPKNFTNNYSKNDIDRNGNFKSNSSSSSSSSQSSGSSSNSGRSTPSNSSEKNHPVQEVQENKCKNNDKIDECSDGDCISLFAESLFTNIDQGANVISLSPLFDGTKDSNDKRLSPLFNDVKYHDARSPSPLFHGVKDCDDKFQDMADVGTYFNKNVEECNAAYESCVQEDDNTLNTSHILTNSTTNEHHDKIIPQLLDAGVNLNQLSLSQPMQSFGTVPSSYPKTTILQESQRIDIAYLKEILVEEKERVFSSYVSKIFDWHCYAKLRRGTCNRDNCSFRHRLGPNLQNLEERNPELIHEIFDCALSKGFTFFARTLYSGLIMRMNYPNIIMLFYKLVSRNLLGLNLACCTLATVATAGISTQAFLTDIAYLLDGKNDCVIDYILRDIDSIIESGAYWNTCRALLVRSKPSNFVLNRVISECIYTGDKLQIEDVYSNYVRNLTAEQELRINPNLRRQFHILLVNKDLIRKIEHPVPAAKFENLDTDDRMFENNDDVPESYHKETIEIPTILSPDDTLHYNYENSSQFSPGHRQLNQKLNTQESSSDFVLQSLTKNQTAGSDSAAGCSQSSFRRWRNSNTLVGSGVKLESTDENIKTLESGGASLSTRPYKLHPIDDLPPPRSAFRDRHWKYHLDMNNLKEALKHEEYSLALKVLNEYSDVDQTIFTSSCYKMLRQNVMASAHHVRNMIKLSVRMGVNNFLSDTLFTFGMYTMIELCNANAWVLAYSLFKSLQSASLTEQVATYALISAEICLANRRPLKAFIILKQNNMFCTNRSEWNVVSDPIDEDIRVMIINLLLDVLCLEYPDWAFYIFTYLVKDQTRIYHPIDLTAYVDKLVTGIITANSNDLISDVGRLIIENNFMLKNSVFQSLIVSIFQTDKALCRQLYRYGTWLGVYSMVKLTLPLHILIKTNWTKEEMYLVVMDFLEKLSMDIGPATDRIGPNQFTIHLVFELAPFKEQVVDNNVEICNKDELKMSKELMKTVLQKLFTPPLRTIIAEKERFMKLQSRSVVNYLKSMMV